MQNKLNTNNKQQSLALDNSTDIDSVLSTPAPSSTVSNKILSASNHFLLHPGAHIAIADCGSGKNAFDFASINPRLRVTGTDYHLDDIKKATQQYKSTNLNFKPSDEQFGTANKDCFDGILNSFNLHYLYSIAGYRRSRVNRYLEKQLESLKKGGMMIIQGYISPDNDENHHILMELSDYKSNSQNIHKLSEAELLIRFSRTARPLDRSGCKGFYLEELKPRIDHTRLFRLPIKWANEFLLRKDNRENWDDELNKEYTPYTINELQREVTRLGGRLVFSAPQWDKNTVEKKYEPRCRLFDENYEILDWPATSQITVIQKIESNDSALVRERRPSSEKAYYLKTDNVMDEDSGRVYDLVSRPVKIIDVIPYRVNVDGRITVYARDSYARPIINTVPRKGIGLDGKIWSGHLFEPITYQTNLNDDVNIEDKNQIEDILKRTTKLSLKPNSRIIEGPRYYSSPAMIDEMVNTIFVEVSNPKQNFIEAPNLEDGFHATNSIKGLDAQDILRAAHVGLLSDGKLELAVYHLMEQLNITPDTWTGDSLPVGKKEPKNKRKIDDIIKCLKSGKKSYKKTLRSGSSLKLHRSLFVEEAHSDGETTGLISKSMEFAVPEDETINVAVVMPLTSDKSGEIYAGFEMIDYPVPARMEGQSTQLDAMSFVLPKEVKTIFDAKRYIAKKFGTKPDRVGQMGSSYFSDAGVTPQRIYPFVVGSPAKERNGGRKMFYAPIKQLGKITFKYCKTKAFMSILSEATHNLGAMHAMHGLSPKAGGRFVKRKTQQKKPSFKKALVSKKTTQKNVSKQEKKKRHKRKPN